MVFPGLYLQVKDIINIVRTAYNFSLCEMMFSPKRIHAEARFVAMVFSKKYLRLDGNVIGQLFMYRDHSTVSHAHKVVANLLSTDKEFKVLFDFIGNRIDTIQKAIINYKTSN